MGEALEVANFDQRIGADIIKAALKQPCSMIAQNAGVDGSVVVSKILEKDQWGYGYNAATDEYCDLIQAGVIDPFKVVRVALADAASVASLLTTTEAVITDIPKKEAPGGGMGVVWVAWAAWA